MVQIHLRKIKIKIKIVALERVDTHPRLTNNPYHVNTFESKTCLQELFFIKINATLTVKIIILSNILAL